MRGFREPRMKKGFPTKAVIWILFSILVVLLTFRISYSDDNLSDIRNARANGMPMVSAWPDGFDLKYQLSILNSGSRLYPVVRMPFPGDGSSYFVVANGAPFGVVLIEPQLSQLGGLNLPLTLRCSNLSDSFGTDLNVYVGISAGRRMRGLLQEISPGQFTLQGTAPAFINSMISANSPIIFKLPSPTETTYDQDKPADAFGPAHNWRLEGSRWANSLWMSRVQELIPNPVSIDFLDNNEGYFDYFSAYVTNGQLKSDADLRKISIRAAEYIKANPGITPDQLKTEILRRKVILYNAAYDGFKGTMRQEWKSVPFNTLGYSSGPDLENPVGLEVSPIYDVSSTGNTPVTYLGGNKKTAGSLTNPAWTRIFNAIPAWEAYEVKNKNSWRDVSVSITDGGAIYGAQIGQTEVITPERFGGFWEFGMWGMRDKGRQVNLRYWQLNATSPLVKSNGKPSLFFSDATAQAAVSLGFADAPKILHGDYFLALVKAVDRIHQEPMRSFYQRGTPVVSPGANPLDSYRKVMKQPVWPPSPVVDNRRRWLNCDVNSPDSAIAYSTDPVQSWSGQIKCWAVATELDGQVLIFAYTPCILGVVNLTVPNYGKFQIDMTGTVSGYWIIEPDGFTAKKI